MPTSTVIQKPKELVDRKVSVNTFSYRKGEEYGLSELLDNLKRYDSPPDEYVVEITGREYEEDDNLYVSFTVYRRGQVPNPNYTQELAKYNKAMSTYKEEAKILNDVIKPLYDQWKQQKDLECKTAQYHKLKKELKL